MSLSEQGEDQESVRRSAEAGRVRSEILLWAREVIREFWRVDATRSASALAFTTLISLVPVLVLLLMLLRGSVESVFPDAHFQLEEILGLVLPYEAPTITRHVKEFVENAQTVSVLGVIVFVLVSFRLFADLQVTVNEIWRVERPRSLQHSGRAFAIFVIGWPVVVGLAVTTNAALRRSPVIRAVIDPDVFPGIYTFGVMLVAFALVFWFLPAARVRFRSAIVGAFLTTSLFELTRLGLGFFFESVFVGRINLIYGAVALLIIFLIVLQLIWIEVLLGVVGSFVYQHFDGIVRAKEGRIETKPEYAAYYALRAVLVIAKSREEGQASVPFDDLAERVESTDPQLLEILAVLDRAGLIAESSEGAGWKLGRDPERISLDEILDAIHFDVLEAPAVVSPDAFAVAVSQLLAGLRGSISESLGGRSVAEVVRSVERSNAKANDAPTQAAPNASPPATSDSQ